VRKERSLLLITRKRRLTIAGEISIVSLRRKLQQDENLEESEVQ